MHIRVSNEVLGYVCVRTTETALCIRVECVFVCGNISLSLYVCAEGLSFCMCMRVFVCAWCMCVHVYVCVRAPVPGEREREMTSERKTNCVCADIQYV